MFGGNIGGYVLNSYYNYDEVIDIIWKNNKYYINTNVSIYYGDTLHHPTAADFYLLCVLSNVLVREVQFHIEEDGCTL